MIDKMQKIKDWISKTQDGLMDANGNFEYPEHEGAFHILTNLDYYIDSLQEEPVSNSDWLTELQEKLDNATPEQLEELWKKYNGVDEEEPVSEELEEAAEKCRREIRPLFESIRESTMEPVTAYDQKDMLAMFKTGAKWQKKQMMKDAYERVVKIDAGGYPNIDGFELWDYDKDVPLAKGGDKVKVVIVKQ